MYLTIILFFLGTLTVQLFEKLPSLNVIISSSIIFLLGIILVIFCKLFNKFTYIIAFFILGFLWTAYNAASLLSWSLPKTLEEKPIVITGKIASLPQLKTIDSFGQKKIVENFLFDTVTIEKQNVRTKISINWYDPQKVVIGQKWQFEVRLKPPHGNSNPGGFDFEKYLFQNKIRSLGYIINGVNNLCLREKGSGYFIGNLRQRLRDTALTTLSEKKMSGTIIALILGDQNGIPKSQWDVFRNTGTSYLMAISGLHIGLAALMFYYLIGLIWKLFPRLILFLPLQRIGTIVGSLAAIAYSVLSGFSIPTQRALIMLLMLALMFMRSREICSLRTLFLALFLVLIVQPGACLFIGFWLSFVAVAFIIYITHGRHNIKKSWWQKYWQMQIAVTLGILPFSLLIFYQVSFVSLLANLFALPLVCSFIVPLSLLGFLTLIISTNLGQIILLFAEKIMEIIWIPLQWMSSLQFLNWYHSIFDYKIFVLSIIGIILILAPKKFPAKWLGIIYCLPLIFNKPLLPKYGEVWFSMLDVGQGLATVVQTKNHVLIYDSGPKFNNGDAGETTIIPFLRFSGINTIDTMVISHGDDDHIGGAHSILTFYKINNLYTSVPEKFPQNNAQFCNDTTNWTWDGVDFKFIYPSEKNNILTSDNDNSCILRINAGPNSILLPGDIEKKTEKWLVENKTCLLPASILVAAHHGSATSSSENFINTVRPEYVLFSTGFLNRFHFPAKSVVTRYLKYNTSILNTANEGAIIFKFNETKIIRGNPVLYRQKNKHYWSEN